jgi:hypothetical protein
MRRRVLTMALCAAALAVGSAPAGAAEALTPEGVSVPTLDWRECDDGLECATAEVPRDYARPREATVELALIRHRAVDPEHRIGTLFLNPRVRDDDRRGRGRGRRSDRGGGGGGYGGGGGGGGGPRGGGGGQRGGGDRGDRGGGRPARREELETHGRDGSFRSSVRIVHVDSEGQRRDREDERRAEREAKRQAEAERLAKLGY